MEQKNKIQKNDEGLFDYGKKGENQKKNKPIIRESIKSLKYLFIVLGAFGIFSFTGVGLISTKPILGLFSLVNGIFGIIEIYIGIKIKEIIRTKTTFIINFLWVYLAYAVINNLYYILTEENIGSTIFSLAVSIIITLYLVNSVKRLSKEPSAETNIKENSKRIEDVSQEEAEEEGLFIYKEKKKE
jgi:hypothetical protein